jgi:alpha-2-macroglobulin
MEFGGTAVASTTQPTELANLQTLLPGTEVMNVRVTPWPTLRIPQGLDYLDRYPYGCVEQTTSALFPLLVLGDLGKQLDSARFDPDRMKETITTGIVHLIEMQTPDGGLAMWPGETKAWPWGTVYAANFLVEARAAGYDVPDDFYNHTLSYARRLLDNATDDASTLEVQAYAAYVLSLAGTPPRAAIDRLTELTNPGHYTGDEFDAVAAREHGRLMLACAWMLCGRHDLAEGMIPQELPLPRVHRQRDGNIGSAIRDRAVLINTLAMVQPNNPALPALVQELADEGSAGRWASTQDTAFAVMAIARYLRLEQKHEPYDTAKLLLGNRVLAEVSGGASLAWDAPSAVTSPALSSATTQPDAPRYAVQLSGSGGAMGYVTWLQSGVPLTAPADASHGISITRRYLTIDGNEIPHNIIRSGDLVLVELTLKSSVPENGLAIEDMLPAGLEIENAHLATSAKEENNSNVTTDGDKGLPRFDPARVDARDDRMVAIGSMPAATARWTYLARAVTPGTFVLPPVRVEAMYDINTNAISGAGGSFVVSSGNANIADIRN